MAEKPKAIIFDIDGTLAHGTGRKLRHGNKAWPYADWDSHDDTVDEHVVKMVQVLSKEFVIIMCSGRKDSSREVTRKWLSDNNITCNNLFMRKSDDNRKDSIVKKELYEQLIKPYWDVFAVFDDRDQVVDMWRNELGLKVFQVAEGNF